MDSQPKHPVKDLTIEDIDEAIADIIDVVGRDWIGAERKRVKDKRRIAVEANADAYLYHPRDHPLIEWSLEHDRWRDACKKSGDIELNEDILRLATLGSALKKTKTLQNFARLEGRLKGAEEFESAVFEIETAATYVSRGWTVEFVREVTHRRTPDLHVRTDQGASFWVECKRRDAVTPRDKHVADFWLELDRNLTKVMVAEKLNYLVEVHAFTDPLQNDLGPLCKQLLRGMRESRDIGAYDFASGESTPAIAETAGYGIIAVRLADADAEYQQGRFRYRDLEKTERFADACECRQQLWRVYVRNQRILAIWGDVIPDRVGGVRNALVEARDQLPRDGPGVVWIRLPDNIWGQPMEQYFTALRLMLSKELTGEHNRRINAVVLHARFVHRPEVPVGTSIGYAPVTVTIEHANPRAPIA
jgi:hypothetical protein